MDVRQMSGEQIRNLKAEIDKLETELTESQFRANDEAEQHPLVAGREIHLAAMMAQYAEQEAMLENKQEKLQAKFQKLRAYADALNDAGIAYKSAIDAVVKLGEKLNQEYQAEGLPMPFYENGKLYSDRPYYIVEAVSHFNCVSLEDTRYYKP